MEWKIDDGPRGEVGFETRVSRGITMNCCDNESALDAPRGESDRVYSIRKRLLKGSVKGEFFVWI